MRKENLTLSINLMHLSKTSTYTTQCPIFFIINNLSHLSAYLRKFSTVFFRSFLICHLANLCYHLRLCPNILLLISLPSSFFYHHISNYDASLPASRNATASIYPNAFSLHTSTVHQVPLISEAAVRIERKT
jgi:hypothetical protein